MLMKESNKCAPLFSEPKQSLAWTAGHMDLSHLPLVGQSFSVPRDVFEEALASQISASISTSSAPEITRSFLDNPDAAAARDMYHCIPRRRRSSGESSISELSECEAKRPRLSAANSVSAQIYAKEIESQNHKREIMKQLVFERIDRTKENIAWMLKMQRMRELLQYYEKSENGSTLSQKSNSQGNELHHRSPSTLTNGDHHKIAISAREENYPRSVTLKRICHASDTIQRATSHGNRLKHLPPSAQRMRRVPGINVVLDPTLQGEQNVGYFCKSYDGLAWDHQALPRIVAVHSVTKHTSVNARNIERAPPSKPAATTQIPSTSNTVGMSDYSAKSQETHMHPLVTSLQCDTRRGTFVSSDSQDHDEVEVKIVKVCPRETHRSRSVQKRCRETSITNRTEYADRGMERPLKGGCVNGPFIAKPTVAAGYGNHSGHSYGCNSRIERISADSEIYLSGPPSYLPVLDNSEIDKLKKQKAPPPVSAGERRNRSPDSPRLAKTIPEISAKIIETRERIKTETIKWKKMLLYKVEKRLIRKLRRVEKETGEKTEVEELREEEAPARVPKKERRRKGQSLQKRSTTMDSVTDSVTDEDEAKKSPGSDALGHFSEAEERKESVDVRVEASRDQEHEQEGIFPSSESKKEEKAAMASYYRNAKDPSTKNGDCVTNEPCQGTNPSINLERLCTKKGLNIGGAEHVQTCTAERNTDSRLSEIRHDKQKSPQDFQTEKYCVTKNLNSLHSGLQNYTKEVRKTKAAAVSCERNIWAVLRGDGNF